MIWCSYAHSGRSKMSTTTSPNRRTRAFGKIARRDGRQSPERPSSAAAHLAEQAYAAELVHAERVHAASQSASRELAAREQGALRALRALGGTRARRRSAAEASAAETSGVAEAATVDVPATGAPAAPEVPAGGAAAAGDASGGAPEPQSHSERRRWLALAVLCLGQLMMVLDATIVNVALPSIQHDLHFNQSNLTWVMNGYLITFGGLLLLAGRLGDLIGRKRVFLSGLVLFTVASVLCGIA